MCLLPPSARSEAGCSSLPANCAPPPLHLAARLGSGDAVLDGLIAHGPGDYVNMCDETPGGNGGTPLAYACTAGQLASVQRLSRAAGVDLTKPASLAGSRATALHCACAAKPRPQRLAVVTSLLDACADANVTAAAVAATDAAGETPLAVALRVLAPDLVAALLEAVGPDDAARLVLGPASAASEGGPALLTLAEQMYVVVGAAPWAWLCWAVTRVVVRSSKAHS